jgi:hypothetical protein
MATRAIIAKLDNKGIKAIYSHSDNYLEHTGKILDQHYHDVDKVDELIAHGDLSIINENIGVKLDFNDYDLFHKNKQCRFYGRDRGEGNRVKAEVLKDETELLEFAFEKCDVDLVYMYGFGSWYVYDNSNAIGTASYQFIELEDALYVDIV